MGSRVGYLGPPGTFGEEAAIRFAPAGELVPYPSHSAVANAVERSEIDLGVLAIENLINGSVPETLDILIHDTSLQIQHELLLPIRHNLVGAPGTTLEMIRVIHSHTQALGQCRHYLDKHLPNAQAEAALSTAQAVELAVAAGPQAAAIATERAAELYGGEILAHDIGDEPNNVTRFVIVGKGQRGPTGHDRTSIAFWFDSDEPGLLASVLTEFASRGINCSKMESRPTRASFGEYVFLIDFEGHRDDPESAAVLESIRQKCSVLKIYGSYPRATR